ncbi:FecR family protein [Lunatimonas salinarum]|uniref:FecR family protein n=1 Tax=Lunatimonas salinarum TaxID=1774590 RepID=UPI001ADFEE97|nr:FecR domain-containing protein [Lunatimonas salinarum]
MRLVEKWRRLMKGLLSAREASDFLKRMESEEGKRAFYQEVESSFEDPNLSESYLDWDKEAVLQKLLEKKRMTKSFWPGMLTARTGAYRRFAASLLLGLLVYGGYLAFFDSNPTSSSEPSFQSQVIVKYNPKGKRTKIQLPDLSWVYLNAESYLAYEQGFPNGREVRLVGEAFFDVTKDSLRPFTVLTGKIQTTALGTSFNIHAYSESPGVQVTLATGEVKVQDFVSSSELHLLPGEASKTHGGGTPMKKFQVDPNSVASWKDGILQFEQLPLSEVVRLLERWYGVSIHGPAAWPDFKCSGTFGKNEYLSNVLEVLGHSIGFDYTIDEKNITIHIKP